MARHRDNKASRHDWLSPRQTDDDGYLVMNWPDNAQVQVRMRGHESQAFVKEVAAIVPERLDHLARLIGRAGRDSGRLMDGTLRSFADIESWAEQNVVVREYTPEERSELEAAYGSQQWNAFKKDDFDGRYTLDERCLSIMMDVGLYIGETIIRRTPQLALRWCRARCRSLCAYYNYPIVAVAGRDGFCPKVAPDWAFEVAERRLNPRLRVNRLSKFALMKRRHAVLAATGKMGCLSGVW